jgi:AraC-like DNA-binding protein
MKKAETLGLKQVRISDIDFNTKITRPIHEENIILKKTIEEMIRNFNIKPHPIVIQKGTRKVLYYHTQLNMVKYSGLDEIPVIEIKIKNHELAAPYTYYKRLSSSEILDAVSKKIPCERQKKGDGCAADQIAQELDISPSTVYHALKLLREAPNEVINNVRMGKISIKKGIKILKASKIKQ